LRSDPRIRRHAGTFQLCCYAIPKRKLGKALTIAEKEGRRHRYEATTITELKVLIAAEQAGASGRG
jgi:hypothetical protein